MRAKARSGRVGLLELESGSCGRWEADPTGRACLSATKERGAEMGREKGNGPVGWAAW